MNALGVFLYDSVRRGRSSHRNAINAKLPISGVVIHKGLFTAHEVNWINLQQVDHSTHAVTRRVYWSLTSVSATTSLATVGGQCSWEYWDVNTTEAYVFMLWCWALQFRPFHVGLLWTNIKSCLSS